MPVASNIIVHADINVGATNIHKYAAGPTLNVLTEGIPSDPDRGRQWKTSLTAMSH